MIHLRGMAARAAAGIVAVEDFVGTPGMLRGHGPNSEPRVEVLRMLVNLYRTGTVEFPLSREDGVTLEIWIDSDRDLDPAERLASAFANRLGERVAVRIGPAETLLSFGEPRP